MNKLNKTQSVGIRLYVDDLPIYDPLTGERFDEYTAANFIEDIVSKAFSIHGMDAGTDDEADLEFPVLNGYIDIDADDEPDVIKPTYEDAMQYLKNIATRAKESADRIEKEMTEKYGPNWADDEPEQTDDTNFMYSDLQDCVDVCMKLFYTDKANNESPESCIPVGFVSPEGKFMLVTSKNHGLAHCDIADWYISQIKNGTIAAPRYRSCYSAGFSDADLEANGWVKLHGTEIHYYSGLHISDTETHSSVESPRVTDVQRDAIVTYMTAVARMLNAQTDILGHINYENEFSVNGKRISITTFKLMERPMFNLLFVM